MKSTTQITLRRVERDFKELLEESAKLSGKSLNKEALSRLMKQHGYGTNTKRSWEELAGTLKDGALNQDVLDSFGRIDSEMWK